MASLKSSILVLAALLGANAVLADDEALPCVYAARATQENPAPEIQSHGGCATVRSDGSLVMHPDQLAELDFRDAVATVLVADQWYYVLSDGRNASVIQSDNGADPFSEGLARTSSADKIGFVDETLRVVIAPRFDFAWPFEKGRALACMGCRRGEADSDGHTPVVGGQWGYIDTTGQAVVPIRFPREEALEMGTR